MKPQDGRRVKSPAHRAAISLGLRRAAWSSRQSVRARQGWVHDLVPAAQDMDDPGRGAVQAGSCHWCWFWRLDPALPWHTGHTFQDQHERTD